MGIRPLQPYSVLLPSHMRRQEGFTLPEILVAIVILGILIASSLPAYRTYQQRAYVSEASLMLRQILTYDLEEVKRGMDNFRQPESAPHSLGDDAL
jgi:prepilin-type N-terminal cleavage/methylation domain-containing protein